MARHSPWSMSGSGQDGATLPCLPKTWTQNQPARFSLGEHFCDCSQDELETMQEGPDMNKSMEATVGIGDRLLSVGFVAAASGSGHSMMQLHWLPGVERRGLGDLVQMVNHIALIVSDVGRSAAFYTDVLGCQQINRPNFDRHGAWFTLGNVELHLIKGVPLVHAGNNLIVSHIAIDVSDVNEAFERLKDMEIPFEINVSVPKGKGKAESEGGDASNTLGQAFIRDPDGYYIEICNCNILTDFALNLNGRGTKASACLAETYNEGVESIAIGQVSKLVQLAMQAKDRVKQQQRRSSSNVVHETTPLPSHEQPATADPVMLANFLKRRQIYGDICQSFCPDELEEILREAGNDAPKAILLMERRILFEGHCRLFSPPAYYVECEGHNVSFKPKSFVPSKRRSTHTARMTAGLLALTDSAFTESKELDAFDAA